MANTAKISEFNPSQFLDNSSDRIINVYAASYASYLKDEGARLYKVNPNNTSTSYSIVVPIETYTKDTTVTSATAAIITYKIPEDVPDGKYHLYLHTGHSSYDFIG